MTKYAIVQVGHTYKTYFIHELRNNQVVEPYIEKFRRHQDAVTFINNATKSPEKHKSQPS